MGSCSSEQCSMPASLAARIVAAISGALNLAGTVMTAASIVSSPTNDLSVFSTSAESSSLLYERPMWLLSYCVSRPMARLNSMKTFWCSFDHDFVALALS